MLADSASKVANLPRGALQGGAGAMASSGRGPAAILALYELLYVYEGQVCCEESQALDKALYSPTQALGA